MDLLARGNMLSLQRNRLLEEMAQRLRPERDDALQGLFDEFLNKYTGTYKNVPSAREYGIPCVTGVPEAFEPIETGDILTVDGYQGIVTIEKDIFKKIRCWSPATSRFFQVMYLQQCH
ncbi:MAG: hypothetical protein E4G89_03710 [Methanothrix sp.]|nr:MAG: hypothetical protein E4G89_03710 [Methanothrix sp.]